MSAMETMVRTLLSATGVNPEEVKGIIEKRVAAFECNMSILNKSLGAMLANQKAIMEHMALDEKYTAPDITAETEKLAALMATP